MHILKVYRVSIMLSSSDVVSHPGIVSTVFPRRFRFSPAGCVLPPRCDVLVDRPVNQRDGGRYLFPHGHISGPVHIHDSGVYRVPPRCFKTLMYGWLTGFASVDRYCTYSSPPGRGGADE